MSLEGAWRAMKHELRAILPDEVAEDLARNAAQAGIGGESVLRALVNGVDVRRRHLLPDVDDHMVSDIIDRAVAQWVGRRLEARACRP